MIDNWVSYSFILEKWLLIWKVSAKYHILVLTKKHSQGIVYVTLVE